MVLRYSGSLALTCSILGGLLLFSGLVAFGTDPESRGTMLPIDIALLAAGSLLIVCSNIVLLLSNRRSVRESNQLNEAVSALVSGRPVVSDESSDAACLLKQYAERQDVLARAIRDLGSGDVGTAERIPGPDDLLSQAVRSASERIRSSSLVLVQRSGLEGSIAEFSELISEAASGDLSGRVGESNNAVTSGLASELNLMMQELSLHIRRASESSSRLETTVADVQDAAAGMIRNSSDQTSHFESTAVSIARLARRSKSLSGSAARAAAPIANLERQAKGISETAANNASATLALRTQAHESLRRTKRIGERSLELTQIVFDLEELADRVNILALNSSLRPDSRGSNESSPASGEVEQVAERTAKLTGQIRQLAHSVSVETLEVSSAMESMIREVILSTSLAERTAGTSGELAAGLEEAAKQIGEVVGSIASQNSAIEELSRSLTGVAETSESIRLGSSKTAEAVRSASQAVADLRSKLDIFKLRSDVLTTEPNELGSNGFVN